MSTPSLESKSPSTDSIEALDTPNIKAETFNKSDNVANNDSINATNINRNDADDSKITSVFEIASAMEDQLKTLITDYDKNEQEMKASFDALENKLKSLHDSSSKSTQS